MESIKTITILSVCSDNPIKDKQYDKLSKIASRYVGTVYRLSDDSIIIIFGLPTAYENDHKRAIESAGELRFNFPSFRMGISTGDISVRSDVMLDYKQIGLTTESYNLACTAEPGQVFINPHLYSLVENTLRCKPHQQSPETPCYEIIGLSEQIKQSLKSKSSRQRGASKERSKSTSKHRKSQKLQSSKKNFSRNFNKWIGQSFGYTYYVIIAIAIITFVLAVLMWGC